MGAGGMDDGWCRVDGDVFGRRVGWMDGWLEGLLALTRADTRARESKQASRGRAGAGASSAWSSSHGVAGWRTTRVTRAVGARI